MAWLLDLGDEVFCYDLLRDTRVEDPNAAFIKRGYPESESNKQRVKHRNTVKTKQNKTKQNRQGSEAQE